jgi:hypothetical protein
MYTIAPNACNHILVYGLMVGKGQGPGSLCQEFHVLMQPDLLLFHFYTKALTHVK